MLCVGHNFFIFYFLFDIVVLSPYIHVRGVSFFSSINVFYNISVIIFFLECHSGGGQQMLSVMGLTLCWDLFHKAIDRKSVV